MVLAVVGLHRVVVVVVLERQRPRPAQLAEGGAGGARQQRLRALQLRQDQPGGGLGGEKMAANLNLVTGNSSFLG